jgi:hypothetical protein
MGNGQIYTHANKVANLCEGLPVGVMSTGSGGIGNESVETLLKDLRRRFSGLAPSHPDWLIQRANDRRGRPAAASIHFRGKSCGLRSGNQHPSACLWLLGGPPLGGSVGSKPNAERLSSTAMHHHGGARFRRPMGRAI